MVISYKVPNDRVSLRLCQPPFIVIIISKTRGLVEGCKLRVYHVWVALLSISRLSNQHIDHFGDAEVQLISKLIDVLSVDWCKFNASSVFRITSYLGEGAATDCFISVGFIHV